MNFINLGLSIPLVTALEKEGIQQPMPIQTEAIPALLERNNAYVSAETGTGKTLAYLLPIFEHTDPSISNAQAIILAPTHELASQINQQAMLLSQKTGQPNK
jgi:ATP-dependent RNA helicase DeaD